MATMADILIAVARVTGVDVQRLRGPGRTRKLYHARILVYYYCRTESEVGKHSLPAIGRVIHRDHTSVIFGLRGHERLMKSDQVYRGRWRMLDEKFHAELVRVAAERHATFEAAAVELGVNELDGQCSPALHIGDAPETAIQCSPFLRGPRPS